MCWGQSGSSPRPQGDQGNSCPLGPEIKVGAALLCPSTAVMPGSLDTCTWSHEEGGVAVIDTVLLHTASACCVPRGGVRHSGAACPIHFLFPSLNASEARKRRVCSRPAGSHPVSFSNGPGRPCLASVDCPFPTMGKPVIAWEPRMSNPVQIPVSVSSPSLDAWFPPLNSLVAQ